MTQPRPNEWDQYGRQVYPEPAPQPQPCTTCQPSTDPNVWDEHGQQVVK